MDIELKEEVWIARTAHYCWGVGRVGQRWIGFAVGPLIRDVERVLFAIPEISEGVMLGIEDLNRAVRMTSAYAASEESDFGLVTEWLIPEEDRGDPEDYRCDGCGQLFCDGGCYWVEEDLDTCDS